MAETVRKHYWLQRRLAHIGGDASVRIANVVTADNFNNQIKKGD